MLPEIGIICGSGLGGLVGTLKGQVKEFNYSEIPNFVASSVAGHAGKLVFGKLSGLNAVFMVGRFHFYEGHTLQQTVLPVRVMKLLGVKTLIVTNAAGGLNPSYNVGDVVIINDHLSFPGLGGQNPLIGPNLESLGPRFPPTSDAYDFELRKFVYRAARAVSLDRKALHEGVYCFVAGPSYETKAEARFLRNSGGDVVGMSSVPEVLVARHCGLRVLGLSLVTNRVAQKFEPCADEELPQTEVGLEEQVACHEEVLAASQGRAKEMQALVTAIVEEIRKSQNV